MDQLVQIGQLKHPWDAKRVLPVINAPREPLLLELVREVSALLGRTGMHEVCKACFECRVPEGENPDYFPRGGCCAECGYLGHDSCLAKPLSCTLWMCTYTKERFSRAYEFLHELRRTLTRSNVPMWVRDTSVEVAWKPTEAQKVLLASSIEMVKAWSVA